LRSLAKTWEFHRSYNQYYLYEIPTHLKTALIIYLGIWHEKGVSLGDLQILLLPWVDDDGSEDSVSPDTSPVDKDLVHLDLTGSIGRSIRLRELADLLFPTTSHQAENPDSLQESWDAPSLSVDTSIRPGLLPNLTHLSLSLTPFSSTTSVSWRQLLSMADNLSTLTHLSLAYWPEPSLTPNAKFATVVSAEGPQTSIPYGGTGPYSHSLDADWSEAVILLRRLARSLYRLEYLDLTGCTSWAPALMATAEHDTVDWVVDWGKISHLLLYTGYKLAVDAGQLETSQYRGAVELGKKVEKHIRARRAGRGRLITVVSDNLDA
jgi:hypothetical protein